jgi:uncharacterized protein YlzI (FlbEa/FlbD family)
MTDEINNLVDDPEIESVDAQAPDTAPEWDYFDPEEDTEEAQAPEATEDGTEEAAPEAEVEEVAEATPDAVVTLPDGTKAKVADLIQGNLRHQDYTRKTQELATVRKTVEADAQRIEGITQAFIDHLTSLVPAAPDTALALRDPNGYVRAKAQHEAALAQVKTLIELGEKARGVTTAISEADKQAMIARENAMLAERVPEVATEKGRQQFFSRTAEVAQDLGFSMDELQGVTDHRIFVLAHYAKVGMEAMKARQVAKAKTQSAPPVAPRKPGQGATAKSGNAEAMRKLARSGSIRDALKIDWD